MHFYLSSYEIGNKSDVLKKLVTNNTISYIPNARDVDDSDASSHSKRTMENMDALRKLGFTVSLLDLKEYFGKTDALKEILKKTGAIFISGGNVFALRQAMALTGLDRILVELRSTNFVYAGYSAAGCVLGPTLTCYRVVDPVITPYSEQKDPIFDGLGFFDWAFMPHFDSDHPESADIDKEIEYCKKNLIPYKAVRDGDVVVIQD